MDRGLIGIGQSGARRGVREHRIHRLQHTGGGAEGMRQAHGLEPGLRRLPRHFLAHVAEDPGIGTLKREDRLLLVADHEQGAVEIPPRAGAREEIVDQAMHHRPLRRTGILRLVHQDMVDASVQLEVNPGRRHPVEQCGGVRDQIIEIQQALADLGRLIARTGARAQRQSGVGALQHLHRPADVLHRRDPVALGIKARGQHGSGVAQPLGDEIAVGARLAIGLEEHRQIRRGRLRRRTCGRRRAQRRRALVIGGLVGGFELRRQGRPFATRQMGAVEHHRGDAGPAGGRLQPESGGDHTAPLVGLHWQSQDTRARVHRGGQERLDAGITGLAHESRKRGTERRIRPRGGFEDQIGADPGQKIEPSGIIQFTKPRGHSGLKGKLMQQPTAKGVNGLDLQAAWSFERGGEQATRLRPQSGRCRARIGAGKLLIEFAITERHPTAKRGEHPVGHVGGGGLGISEAQNAPGRHARQQQSDHPLSQHMGFSRAGIGRDPGGGRRIGRRALIAGGGGERRADGGSSFCGDAHALSSSAPNAHSRTRAR